MQQQSNLQGRKTIPETDDDPITTAGAVLAKRCLRALVAGAMIGLMPSLILGFSLAWDPETQVTMNATDVALLFGVAWPATTVVTAALLYFLEGRQPSHAQVGSLGDFSDHGGLGGRGPVLHGGNSAASVGVGS